MMVLKKLKRASTKRDAAPGPVKKGSFNVQRALAFKSAFAVVGPKTAQLTSSTRDVSLPELAGPGETVRAPESVQIVAAERRRSAVAPKVRSAADAKDLAGRLTLVTSATNSTVAAEVTATADSAARSVPTERFRIETAATERATVHDAKGVDASVESAAQSPVYVLADLVAEVMRLRLAVESALAALEHDRRPRSAGRRVSTPIGPVLLEGLAGKKLMDEPVPV